MNSAEKIKKLRRDKGITMRELANELDIGVPAIAKYEDINNPRIPRYEILARLAHFFDVDIEYLLNDEAENITTENIKINKLLGLSDEAIKLVKTNNSNKKSFYLNFFLENINLDKFTQQLEYLTEITKILTWDFSELVFNIACMDYTCDENFNMIYQDDLAEYLYRAKENLKNISYFLQNNVLFMNLGQSINEYKSKISKINEFLSHIEYSIVKQKDTDIEYLAKNKDNTIRLTNPLLELFRTTQQNLLFNIQQLINNNYLKGLEKTIREQDGIL